MNLIKQLLLGAGGFSFGLLSSAGVFTVLAGVGLIPRFAGRFHLARYSFWLEEAVIGGAIIGGLASVFIRWLPGEGWLIRSGLICGEELAGTFLAVFGLFSGVFVGCLALAIAEMLDSIPIFARRIGFRHGLGVAILGVAAGKLWGSLWFFLAGLST